MNEIERFYKSLYSCYGDNLKEVVLNSIISSEYYSRLNKNSSSELEGFISKEEALSALKLMKNNKSPGSDGFATKFYQFFWRDLGIFLVRSLNYGFSI